MKSKIPKGAPFIKYQEPHAIATCSKKTLEANEVHSVSFLKHTPIFGS